MNTKVLWTASLAGGLISTVLVNTPFVNFVNLLFCAGFWIGPIVAVWLYRRQVGMFSLSLALISGLLAGAWHGIFGLLLSPLGVAGAGGMLNDLRQFDSSQDLPDLEAALTGIGGLVFNLVGMAVAVVFGLLGGLIGGAIFRTGRTANTSGAQI